MTAPPTAPAGVDLGEDLTYNPGPMRARLRLHPTDNPQFIEAFTESVGGSLHPDHGGNWERTKKASAFLHRFEKPGGAKTHNALVERYLSLPIEDRGLVNAFGATAGIPRHCRSVLLTDGESEFYDWVITHIKIAGAEGTFDAILKGFDLPADFPVGSLDDGTEEGGHDTPSSEAPFVMPKRTAVVIEDDVVIPDGYTDGVPKGMTERQTKDYIYDFVHRALIAELERPKPRSGVVKWLEAKCKGFKIDPSWRIGENP